MNRTREQRAELARKFAQLRADGVSLKEIEKKLKVQTGKLYAWKKQFIDDAEPTPKTHSATKYDPKLRQQALEMVAKGEKLADIGRKLGIQGALVSYWKKVAKPGTLGTPELKANGKALQNAVDDALIWLRQAEKEMLEMLRDGKLRRQDPVHRLAMMALGELEKTISKQ